MTEKTAHTRADLPAGSYDAAKLDKGMAAAAGEKDPAKRAEAEAKAIKDAKTGAETKVTACPPGYKMKEFDGPRGKETRMVYDRKLDPAAVEKDKKAPAPSPTPAPTASKGD